MGLPCSNNPARIYNTWRPTCPPKLVDEEAYTARILTPQEAERRKMPKLTKQVRQKDE